MKAKIFASIFFALLFLAIVISETYLLTLYIEPTVRNAGSFFTLILIIFSSYFFWGWCLLKCIQWVNKE
jgi:hypothetical protein